MTETESKIHYLKTMIGLSVSNAHGKYYVSAPGSEDVLKYVLIVDEDQLDALIDIAGHAELKGHETGYNDGCYERDN